MSFVLTAGTDAEHIRKPTFDVALPAGVLSALRSAQRFTGRHVKTFPWQQYVYLISGKIYATDNQCIVEIDLGEPSLGPARFVAKDIAILKTMKDDPDEAYFGSGEAAFSWVDGRWFRFDQDMEGVWIVDRCRALLDEFWHECDGVSDLRLIAKAASDIRASDREKKATLSGDEKRAFRPAQYVTVEIGDKPQTWHIGAIHKVSIVATSFDVSASPAPFSFPKGRGLIVKQSQGNIEL